MSGQKFYTNPATRRVEPNGAISYAPGGPMDCIGHYAKIQNCPIFGTMLRRTCYATGYPDSMWSVPACTTIKGKRIRGFICVDADGPSFMVAKTHQHLIAEELEVGKVAQVIEQGI